jgi:hypothetical protein
MLIISIAVLLIIVYLAVQVRVLLKAQAVLANFLETRRHREKDCVGL